MRIIIASLILLSTQLFAETPDRIAFELSFKAWSKVGKHAGGPQSPSAYEDYWMQLKKIVVEENSKAPIEAEVAKLLETPVLSKVREYFASMDPAKFCKAFTGYDLLTYLNKTTKNKAIAEEIEQRTPIFGVFVLLGGNFADKERTAFSVIEDRVKKALQPVTGAKKESTERKAGEAAESN